MTEPRSGVPQMLVGQRRWRAWASRCFSVDLSTIPAITRHQWTISATSRQSYDGTAWQLQPSRLPPVITETATGSIERSFATRARVESQRLVETNAPISTEVTVTHQQAQDDRPERWMVHVVNFSANRRTPEHTDYLEDPIPLHAIRLAVALDVEIVRAYSAADGAQLALSRQDERWSVVVPRIDISTIVVLETAHS